MISLLSALHIVSPPSMVEMMVMRMVEEASSGYSTWKTPAELCSSFCSLAPLWVGLFLGPHDGVGLFKET